MSINYEIILEKYTKKHHIKDFKAKYKKAWNMTYNVILKMLQNLSNFLTTSKANIIKENTNYKIVKCEFNIVWTNVSTKNSGNRYVIFVDRNKKIIKILLIYHKWHIPKNKKETVWWKDEIRSNYKDICKLLEF